MGMTSLQRKLVSTLCKYLSILFDLWDEDYLDKIAAHIVSLVRRFHCTYYHSMIHTQTIMHTHLHLCHSPGVNLYADLAVG